MPLTDVKLRSLQAREKPYKVGDAFGLYAYVTTTGSVLWRLKYRFAGKEKTLAFGAYPLVGLAEARGKRDEARRLLAAGTDPGETRRIEKLTRAASAATTFGLVAKELKNKKRREGKAERTIEKMDALLAYAGPLWDRPVAEIEAPEILAALRVPEQKGLIDTAHRCRGLFGEVFRYAVATGRAKSDPTRSLRGALVKQVVTNRRAIVEPALFGGLMRAINGHPNIIVRSALELLALTAARPGELRLAHWSEFDLDGAIWTIPAARMKMRREHRVPLSPQALAILTALRKLTGMKVMLLPGARGGNRPLSENTLNAALATLGYGKAHTAHGFRSSFSTIANESGRWSSDAIERCLAHQDDNEVRRVYARQTLWPVRVNLMAWWGDEVEAMTRGGKVVSLRSHVTSA